MCVLYIYISSNDSKILEQCHDVLRSFSIPTPSCATQARCQWLTETIRCIGHRRNDKGITAVGHGASALAGNQTPDSLRPRICCLEAGNEHHQSCLYCVPFLWHGLCTQATWAFLQNQQRRASRPRPHCKLRTWQVGVIRNGLGVSI